jgi:hypothetical protein
MNNHKWARFSGGSGAPLWTLYACGFDPANFQATEAALFHDFSKNSPKMVWNTSIICPNETTDTRLPSASIIYHVYSILCGTRICSQSHH